MLTVGQSFGRYVVEELIGAGGMGHVFRAHDTVLHRHVALKLLVAEHGDPAHWAEAKARMLREARAAAALQHPNAVAIFDLGMVDDTPYIAMELVPGESLRAYVGDRSVPWERKLRWLLDVASALAAAHAAGLVHRDIKPENILVRADGQVKVLDFGIARRTAVQGTAATISAELPSMTITGAGQVLGTPKYMAPEQISGHPLDGRADQFAWGVTAFELLAGTAPWAEKTDALAAAAAILTELPPPLLSVAPELPLAVGQAIDRALSKRPDDRYPLMEDVIAALEPHAAPFVPPSVASRPALSGRPSGSSPGASSSPGSSPRSVDPFAHTESRPETTKGFATDHVSRRGKRRGRRVWVVPAALVAAMTAGAVVFAIRSSHAPSPLEAVPAPSASATSSAMTLTDLPRPSSPNAEALTLYAAAIQAAHDANGDQARAQYLEAATKDPSMAAAHLRYALEAFFPSSDEPRKHFSQATRFRAALSPYDQALLDAVEPIFDRQPPEWAEAERHLVEATRRLPNDSELFATLAWVRDQLADEPGVLAASEAALALDPRYAAALHEEAVVAIAAGDWKAGSRAADRCVEVTPQATSCVRLRMYGEAREGRCRDYEQDARRIIAIDPGSAEGYQRMAAASFVLGRPADAVWEALGASWKRLSGDATPWNKDNDRFNLASLLGDAANQDKGLRGMEQFAKDRTEALYHLIPAWGSILLLTEAGQLDRAAAIAEDFLRRQEAWTVDPGIDSFSVSFDMTPFMLKALVRAGKMSPGELESRRGAWVDGWKRRLTKAVGRYLWIYGYATIVDTPDEAKAALAALPEYEPLPEFRPSLLSDADVGRTLLLGGRVDEAIPVLRSAAGDCDAFENGIEWVQSSFWLGRALEAKGDKAGACRAYGDVVKRWGGLGKRSVTAGTARKRMAALACR